MPLSAGAGFCSKSEGGIWSSLRLKDGTVESGPTKNPIRTHHNLVLLLQPAQRQLSSPLQAGETRCEAICGYGRSGSRWLCKSCPWTVVRQQPFGSSINNTSPVLSRLVVVDLLFMRRDWLRSLFF